MTEPTKEAMNLVWRQFSNESTVEVFALAIDAHTASLRAQLAAALEARGAWAKNCAECNVSDWTAAKAADARLRALGVSID